MEGKGREKNPASVRAIESGSSWAERRENLFEKVEGDVLFFENTYREILNIKPDTDEELLRIKFNRIKEETKDHFPAVRELLKEIDTLTKRIQDSTSEDGEKYSESYRKNPNISSEEASQHLATRANDRTKLEVERSKLEDNPDLQLAKKIFATLDQLEDKFLIVRDYQNRKRNVFKHHFLSGRMREEDCDVDYRAFDIDIFVKNPAVMKSYPSPHQNPVGLHLPGTPLNLLLYKEGGDREKLAKHESIHNLLDSADLPRGSSGIAKDIEALKKIPMTLEILKEIRVESVLDALQEELLAVIQNIEGIQYWPTHPSPEERFFYATQNLDTAGGDAVRFFTGLEILVLVESNPVVEAAARNMREKFVAQFNRMIDGILESFSIAKRHGEDAELMAHVGMLVLSPSKYYQLPKLLKRRYPENRQEKTAITEK